MFIDSAKIRITAGAGGAGCVAFRREKYVPKGGPSGGDGGHGGDIVAVADRHIHTLLDFKYQTHYQAKRGQHGMGDNKTGKSAESLQIRMPIGTIIKNSETGEMIADMAHDGQQKVIAKGGRGGRGNARFSTPTNRTPREWESGFAGEDLVVELELKLLADIGLVGLPNAGKSTLLSRISAARPKIADYPFTTLVPNLGIVRVDDLQSFVAADIPGLVAGAHQGKGLGIQFLRHIERTKVLAILLDCTSENLAKDYQTLMNELASYSESLMLKRRILVYTKADLSPNGFQPIDSEEVQPIPFLIISSVRGDNLDTLKQMLWDVLQEVENMYSF